MAVQIFLLIFFCLFVFTSFLVVGHIAGTPWLGPSTKRSQCLWLSADSTDLQNSAIPAISCPVQGSFFCTPNPSYFGNFLRDCWSKKIIILHLLKHLHDILMESILDSPMVSSSHLWECCKTHFFFSGNEKA